MHWWSRRKNLALLLALILLVAVYPVLHGFFAGRLLFDVLYTVVFLAALLVVFAERKQRLMALVFGIPTLIGVWIGYALPGVPRTPLVLGFHVLATLFLVFTLSAILRSVLREQTVSADGVYGAFCGYLLVGLIFGHLYCFIETITPGSFRGHEVLATQLQDETRRSFLLGYFSLVTLTTVGYGDIMPASDTARGLAVVEAITGQFYIAVLIAELIGKRVAQAITGNGNNHGSHGARDTPDVTEA